MNFALTTTGGNAQTMTLKEITDLLDVRHNDAMNVVERMAADPEFGMITKISYSSPMPNGGFRAMETYQLNKRQSIAVAARLNTALLMRIVDRWQELEDRQYTIAHDASAALMALRSGMNAAGEIVQRLESVLAQIAPAQLPSQDACAADVIKYLMKHGEVTAREFQAAKHRVKPWSLIRPKSAIGAAMRATFADLEQKGVITRNGSHINLNTIH